MAFDNKAHKGALVETIEVYQDGFKRIINKGIEETKHSETFKYYFNNQLQVEPLYDTIDQDLLYDELRITHTNYPNESLS